MITMNIDNQNVGKISVQFTTNNDALNFLNSLNRPKTVSHKKQEHFETIKKSRSYAKGYDTFTEEPMRKSLTAPTTETQNISSQPIPKEEEKEVAKESIEENVNQNPYKKTKADNRRKRNYSVDRNQLLKYCIEAITQNNNEELTLAELSNIIARNLGLSTDKEKTDFYRYLYQFVSNRSKKSIDLIKNKNYVSLKINSDN